MWHSFTPASHRAILYASGWSSRAEQAESDALSLLVGLVSEPECRAALILAQRGIDLDTIRRHWPDLFETPPTVGESPIAKPLSHEVTIALQLVDKQLSPLLQPLEFATEHLLFGLLSADDEVAIWLREQGFDPTVLEREILALNGCVLATSIATEPYAAEPFAGEPCEPAHDAGTAETQQTAILRVLDAAVNRAREGLRVVEDYVRFVLDDRYLASLGKQLRHDLTEILERFPLRWRLAARETQADIGTLLTTVGEAQRAGAADVLTANITRLQEALRTIEEYGKLIDADAAARVKQIRYRAYTLQRAVEITEDSRDRLAGARLYVIIDGRRLLHDFERLAKALIEAGAGVIQLRDKQLSDRHLLERARCLRRWTEPTPTLFIMNDRPDLALLARADGVHIGQEELSVKDARTVIGPDRLIGVSAHSLEQARQAVLDGANYLGVGPTFPSSTKSFTHFSGLELVRQVAAEIRLPAFVIGGIDRNNVDQVLAAGGTRIAVSSAVTLADNPRQAVQELLDRIQRLPGERTL
jgi:thiamine-phosphate pyrophosphorylase